MCNYIKIVKFGIGNKKLFGTNKFMRSKSHKELIYPNIYGTVDHMRSPVIVHP